KLPNEELDPSEERYNKMHSGKRSEIESFFATLSNTMKKFGPNTQSKCSDLKVYNLQYKLAILLLNVKKFVEKFNIPVMGHHKQWLDDKFDFPIRNEDPISVTERAKECIDNHKSIRAKQMDF